MTTISSISMPKAMRQITLRMVVTGVGRARARIWIGTKLLRLAGAVIGCGVEIVSKPTDDRLSARPTR